MVSFFRFSLEFLYIHSLCSTHIYYLPLSTPAPNLAYDINTQLEWLHLNLTHIIETSTMNTYHNHEGRLFLYKINIERLSLTWQFRPYG